MKSRRWQIESGELPGCRQTIRKIFLELRAGRRDVLAQSVRTNRCASFFGKSESARKEQNQIYPALFVISNQLLEP